MSLEDEAKAIWNFNNKWNDEKNNHPITNVDGVFDTDIKKLGSASACYNGADNYGIVANHADFNQSAFTLSCWIYIPTIGQLNGLIAKFQTGSATGWGVGIDNTDTVLFYAGDGVSWPAFSVTKLLDPGSKLGWHHVVARHDDSIHEIFVDGALTSGPSSGSIATNSIDLWLNRDTASGAYWNGCLDACYFWTRILTNAEVGFLYNGGKGRELGTYASKLFYFFNDK